MPLNPIIPQLIDQKQSNTRIKANEQCVINHSL